MWIRRNVGSTERFKEHSGREREGPDTGAANMNNNADKLESEENWSFTAGSTNPAEIPDWNITAAIIGQIKLIDVVSTFLVVSLRLDTIPIVYNIFCIEIAVS